MLRPAFGPPRIFAGENTSRHRGADFSAFFVPNVRLYAITQMARQNQARCSTKGPVMPADPAFPEHGFLCGDIIKATDPTTFTGVRVEGDTFREQAEKYAGDYSEPFGPSAPTMRSPRVRLAPGQDSCGAITEPVVLATVDLSLINRRQKPLQEAVDRPIVYPTHHGNHIVLRIDIDHIGPVTNMRERTRRRARPQSLVGV